MNQSRAPPRVMCVYVYVLPSGSFAALPDSFKHDWQTFNCDLDWPHAMRYAQYVKRDTYV